MLHQRNATTFLLLGLSIALPRGARSHVLVKEGFRLVKQSSNDGKLTSGGSSQGASYYSGGDCSSIKYVDACSELEGARFYERDGLDGIYVVDGDTVTKCSKYRSEWQCNQCTLGRCNSSSGENFGGSTTTYRLEPSPGGIASLASLDGRDYCYKVCTNADGTIAIGDEDAEAECAKGGGWYLVDEGYDTPCDISGAHECRESGRSCTSYSLSEGWSDDCCPGSYCSSDRCRENVRNERMCRTNNQPCSSDADCCVGYACSDFVYQSAAKACKSLSDDCTKESWKPDEDDPCCEGTEEAEMVDEDGETIVYCKATPNGITAQSASGTSDGGDGGGGENQKDVTVNDSDKDSGNVGSNGGDIFSASEACADLGQVEAHMTASFKTMLPGTPVTTGYDCKCTKPDPATVQIDCTLPYSRDGEDFTNFERAILGTISPASTQLVLKSIAWGDTVYNPYTVGYFQETFFYDEAGESMTSCTANGCATCEICPDGESFAVDCSALPGDLAFVLSCGDVSTTAFLAEYYSGNPTQLNKDKSASPIRGHEFSSFLGVSTLLMIHAIFIY